LTENRRFEFAVTRGEEVHHQDFADCSGLTGAIRGHPFIGIDLVRLTEPTPSLLLRAARTLAPCGAALWRFEGWLPPRLVAGICGLSRLGLGRSCCTVDAVTIGALRYVNPGDACPRDRSSGGHFGSSPLSCLRWARDPRASKAPSGLISAWPLLTK
jgi:hypothetical protein